MCDQKVVRKSKLTHVVFNPKAPLLLVGDDRGGVLCLKVRYPAFALRCGSCVCGGGYVSM